ncbi:glycosyltransferase [Mesorhizobium sp. M0898]|uniref:glycosyltransferase n=1 Tax=Mesorhizobium sp. M0898 TaxID=2957020 RepID=UPI00333A00BF
MSHSGNRKLSVGIVLGSASRAAGGLFVSVRRTAQALATAGCDITVYSLGDRYTKDDLEAWAPVRTIIVNRQGPASIGYSSGMGMALARGDHDVIHQHGIWQVFSRQVFSRSLRSRRPVIISPRGMLDSWALGVSSMKKRVAYAVYEGANLKNAACLHALSSSEEASMRDFGLTNPIAVIPNGIDPAPRSAKFHRPRFMPNDGKKTLLFIGRLHRKKGLTELIQAWATLLKLNTPLFERWRLVIAGWDDGGYELQLRSAIAEAGISENVVISGPLFDVNKIAALHHADAFILPSHSEGMPMAVLEAWAHSLPVFMTSACNLPEGFRANAAMQISVEPTIMAQQLITGLSASDLPEIGRNGQALVSNTFSWASVAESQLGVYRWMHRGGDAPGCVSFA